MASVKVEAVVREQNRMGECPVWEAKSGHLVYVDINAQKVCRWNSLSGEVQSVKLDARVGSVGLREAGGYVVALGTSLGFLDWDTGSVATVARLETDKPNNRFNDGKVDPAGRFVAGTMPEALRPGVWERRQGALYTLFADGSVVRQLDQLDISNGLDWSPDHRTFFHIDSLTYSVRAFGYDLQTGRMADRRPVYRLEEEEGMPDGMCVDAEGKLWVACIDGGRVIRVDPETGTRLRTVKLPTPRVTSCCFGGPDHRDLFVTSASDGLGPDELRAQPQAGHIFKITGLGVKGVPQCAFAG
ncbi:regucalcin-like isoform X1 [Ornithorhynchus anatinus]|nr:regucalcin-like isoform X1 [Ornithorhynchus anatinus]XP_028935734.1 regucalcin-like isoform X1 [Ornithorhynchus anatinus]XP_028935735.1 regucalcin-like isoform X1 [Ornithorhynchus anatinus]XP_028935736.1 regucalcin-like isoform X1 [Ornithorhynchus anatinus]